MINNLKTLFSRKRKSHRRKFYPYVLTLEPSYACNLSCKMCPRGNNPAPDAIMTEEVFSRIEPYLHWFKFVHLCGFGEPLMHPRIDELVRRIYQKGCLVSFVTNGVLLTPELIKRLLAPDKKIKEIAVSIDAAHKEAYESIRGKGNFTRLIENLHELKRQVEKSEHKPQLTWAFLMMKSNLAELPDAVELAGRIGFDRIVGKHIETGHTVDELNEALFDTGYVPPPDKETEQRFHETLRESAQRGQKYGIRFEVHPRRMIIDGTCGSQPLRALYIDYAGNVSSCCYLNVLDVRPYMNRRATDDNGVMGNVKENSLDEIIKSERFQEFISYWRRGALPPVCQGCLLARRMQLKEEQFEATVSTIT
ncbi:radical SAM protein [Candidatus Sumerlaeota bacterium]|nr:radical SAM protein [Candidatus Sumerlaeota bacterium]